MRLTLFTGALCAAVALAACGNETGVTDSADDSTPTAEDDAFDAAVLRHGSIRVRPVRVPAGYSFVDMNSRGDLLLNGAWLPKERRRPLPLPFIGGSINNRQQIFSSGLSYWQLGRMRTLPEPCTPIGTEVVWDCINAAPRQLLYGMNGDVLVTMRQDATGTMYSPHFVMKVWRARERQWEVILDDWGESIGQSGQLSLHGAVVVRRDNWPQPVLLFTRVPNGPGANLRLEGACPGPNTTALEATPYAVNDLGDVVGSAVCNNGTSVDGGFGVRWSRDGLATPFDGLPRDIDNFGNIVGTDHDGIAVVWLGDGTALPLSEPGGQPAVPVKFLAAGKLLGRIGNQPVIWRFGFRGYHVEAEAELDGDEVALAH